MNFRQIGSRQFPADHLARHRLRWRCLTLGALFVVVNANTDAMAQDSWSSAFAEGNQALETAHPNRAEQQFRRAMTLVKKQSKNPSDLDKVQLKLADTLAQLGRAGEARTMLQKLLNDLSSGKGDNSRITPVLMQLGSIEESAGDHAKAMEYYNRSLSLAEKNYGPYSPNAAIALHGLGRVKAKTGNRSGAESDYKRAITILSKSPDLDAAEQLKTVMHNYSDLISGSDQSDKTLIKDFQKDILNAGSQPANASPQGKPIDKSYWQQQSESQLKGSRSDDTTENTKVALRGIQLPSSDQTLTPAFKVVSDTVFGEGRYRLGEAQYQRMIATDIDSLGPNHPSVGNDLNGLAQVYIAQGRYRDAQPLLKRALAIYDSAYGSQNSLTINTRASLAACEFQLGNDESATKLYNNALNSAQETLGPNSLETAKILNGLAYMYFQRGQLDKSCTFYEWALASTERAVGDKDPLLAACLNDYAQVLRRLDKTAKAVEFEQRAGQILGSSGKSN